MDYRMVNIIRIVILTVAVVFIVTGVFRGEAAEVFNKATAICLSCMGIAK